MILKQVKDIQGNHYMVVDKMEFARMECFNLEKDDYFGYITEEGKFISCKAHKDKNPQALFVTHHSYGFLNTPINKTKPSH